MPAAATANAELTADAEAFARLRADQADEFRRLVHAQAAGRKADLERLSELAVALGYTTDDVRTAIRAVAEAMRCTAVAQGVIAAQGAARDAQRACDAHRADTDRLIAERREQFSALNQRASAAMRAANSASVALNRLRELRREQPHLIGDDLMPEDIRTGDARQVAAGAAREAETTTAARAESKADHAKRVEDALHGRGPLTSDVAADVEARRRELDPRYAAVQERRDARREHLRAIVRGDVPRPQNMDATMKADLAAAEMTYRSERLSGTAR